MDLTIILLFAKIDYDNYIYGLDKMDLVLLALDEICDNGILMETDPDTVISRAQLRMDDLPLAEQTVAQVQAGFKAKMDATSALVQSAKEQLKWSLLK